MRMLAADVGPSRQQPNGQIEMRQQRSGEPSSERLSAEIANGLDPALHNPSATSRPAASASTPDPWLASLIVATPEDGFALAIKLSRVAVKKTQPSDEVRRRLRAVYEENADALIATSQVVAINFQTVAAANRYWRPSKP